MTDASDTGRLHAIERWTLGLGAALTVGAFLFLGRGLGLGVSIGAALMSMNAIAMRRIGEKIWRVMRADAAGKKGRPLRAVVLFNLKMAAVIAVVYVVVTRLHVNPIGLIIGLSSYPLAAVAVALTYVPPADAADGDAPLLPPTPLEDHNG